MNNEFKNKFIPYLIYRIVLCVTSILGQIYRLNVFKMLSLIKDEKLDNKSICIVLYICVGIHYVKNVTLAHDRIYSFIKRQTGIP